MIGTLPGLARSFESRPMRGAWVALMGLLHLMALIEAVLSLVEERHSCPGFFKDARW